MIGIETRHPPLHSFSAWVPDVGMTQPRHPRDDKSE
jgi:hypothetical protein